MPKYLVVASYTSEGINGILDKGGTSRRDALEAACTQSGGKLDSFYFAFGEADAYVTVDMPDNVAVAALCLRAAASGLVGVKTTVLLTPEEIDAAGQAQTGYRPPGS